MSHIGGVPSRFSAFHMLTPTPGQIESRTPPDPRSQRSKIWCQAKQMEEIVCGLTRSVTLTSPLPRSHYSHPNFAVLGSRLSRAHREAAASALGPPEDSHIYRPPPRFRGHASFPLRYRT